MTRSVLLVGNFLSRHSNPHYCEQLADKLETRGWNVIRTSDRARPVERLADMLYTTFARRRDYEIAHVDVFSGAAFVWAELVCLELRRLGKPYMLTLRGGLLGEFARRWPRRVRRILDSAALVAAPSEYLRVGLRPYRAEIRLIRNAIDTHAYTYASRTHVEPRLVWVRAFHSTYNPVLAVDALARLRRSLPEVTLQMLGPDKGDGTAAAVERRAHELGVSDRLSLPGRVQKSELPRYLSSADIFINTTNADNTPISVLEAMAAGLCVVSTSVGGIPFLLSHEQHALLVPPRDPDAMTSAIERLVADPALASRLCRSGHELALQCDWDPVLDQWERALSEVAARA